MVFTAAYATLSRTEIGNRVAAAEAMLEQCTLCRRLCTIDRTAGELGACRTGTKPLVASWGPHFGEERPLVGRSGSGAIFFANCNLGCIFCQNWDISHVCSGSELSFERLAEVMLELQEEGCHNINLVTPTHQMPMILRSVAIAIERGLKLPLVYNCGGYEPLEALRILDGIIDIYMPDFKYADPEAGSRYSLVKDYPQVAGAAVKEMHRQVGDLVIDERGIAVRGLLVRHLVLPGGIAGTRKVVRFIAEEISKDTYINIMDQYHPAYHAFGHPPLDRRITREEYDEAVRAALDAGLRRIDGVTV
ncbi:MAG: radical SAM protein [Nitrospirota bacterium]